MKQTIFNIINSLKTALYIKQLPPPKTKEEKQELSKLLEKVGSDWEEVIWDKVFPE